ncbi:unnamed protein product [Adineta ricciae]|uniref:MATH domain-containing protein n=1 Tax=Adineta ricciae TaxID=249248 RepID=A0A815WFV8_ADIRI|nr:unnamed protein product [Adineta ricciae]
MSRIPGESVEYEWEEVLTWPRHVSSTLHHLFGAICRNVSQTVNYVSKEIFKKGPFHMTMLPKDFEILYNDPVYQFSQVKKITVVCSNEHQVRAMKFRFPYDVNKTTFVTLDELLRTLQEINQNTAKEIRRVYEEHCQSEKSAISRKLCCTELFGCPMNRSANITPESLCSSCELIIQQAFHLKCDHFVCKICLHTKTKCQVCDKDISFQAALHDEDKSFTIRTSSVVCFACEWDGLTKEYSSHLSSAHPLLLAPVIEDQPNIDCNTIQISRNGTCIWKISGVEFIKHNAVLKKQASIYSPAFYIHPKGYKICMRLYVNGDLTGEDAYISLFYVIKRGEYDDTLKWPFNLQVTFTLIDQSSIENENGHVVKSCCPDKNSACLCCPQFDMNDAYGFPQFCPVAVLGNESGFVQDDTMLIKVQLQTPAEETNAIPSRGIGQRARDQEHVTNDVGEDIDALISV